jgi:hypothetical protein
MATKTQENRGFSAVGRFRAFSEIAPKISSGAGPNERTKQNRRGYSDEKCQFSGWRLAKSLGNLVGTDPALRESAGWFEPGTR